MNWFNTSRIRLRAVVPEDAQFMSHVECDPLNFAFNGYTAPLSERQLIEYALNYDADPFRACQLRLIAESQATQERLGILDFIEISAKDSHAFVGVYVVDTFRRQGLGTELLSMAAKYASNLLRITILGAKIVEDNIASRRLFTKAGYEENGRLPEWVFSPVSRRAVDLLFFSRRCLEEE